MKKLEACKIYVDPGFYMLTSESTQTVTSMPGMCAMDISVDSSTNEYIFISSYFEDGNFKCEYQALADEHRWWTEHNKGKENNAEIIKRHLDIRPTEGLPNKSSNFTIYNHKQCQGNELQIVPSSSELNETVPSSPESREDKSDGNITTIVASATSAVVFIIVAVALVMWWRKHMECTLCDGNTTLEENELYGGYYQEQDTRVEDSNALYDDDGEYDYLS